MNPPLPPPCLRCRNWHNTHFYRHVFEVGGGYYVGVYCSTCHAPAQCDRPWYPRSTFTPEELAALPEHRAPRTRPASGKAQPMTSFKVWDPLNDSEAEASTIEAVDVETAAEAFAEKDTYAGSGEAYLREAHKLHVRDPEGALHEVRVRAETNLIFVGAKS